MSSYEINLFPFPHLGSQPHRYAHFASFLRLVVHTEPSSILLLLLNLLFLPSSRRRRLLFSQCLPNPLPPLALEVDAFLEDVVLDLEELEFGGGCGGVDGRAGAGHADLQRQRGESVSSEHSPAVKLASVLNDAARQDSAGGKTEQHTIVSHNRSFIP
jgi:hypothetical protein